MAVQAVNYSSNTLQNGGAEQDLNSWAATNVTIAAGGTSGSKYFRLTSSASLTQTVSLTDASFAKNNLHLGLQYFLTSSYTEQAQAFFKVLLTYDVGTDTIISPLNSKASIGFPGNVDSILRAWNQLDMEIPIPQDKILQSITVTLYTTAELSGDACIDDIFVESDLLQSDLAPDSVGTNQLQDGSVTTSILANACITTAKIGLAQITTATIADAAINTAKIADLAVSEAKIVNAAITTAKIADAAIITAKIVDAAITNAKIAYAAIGTVNIQSAAITSALIQDLAVTSAKIANSTIINANIANATITGAKIAAATIDTANIATAAITSALINDAAITTAKIEDAAILTAKIGDAQISSAKIADAAITNTKIDRASINKLVVTSADIADAAITDAKIDRASVNKLVVVTADLQDAAITTAKIGDAQINAAKILDGTITNAEIANATITGAKIASATIDTANIKAAAITTALIADSQITSAKIANASITDAQVVSIAAGKITSGTIDTTVVTVQGSNGHLKISGNRLQVFDAQQTPVERVSVGDVNNDGTAYGLRVRGADGTTVLYDQNGVYNAGITDGAITNPKIGDSAINNRVIQANTITGDRLIADTITAREIATSTITANEIVAGTITATQIAAATITGAKIASSTITGANIVDATITGAQIAAKAITVDKLWSPGQSVDVAANKPVISSTGVVTTSGGGNSSSSLYSLGYWQFSGANPTLTIDLGANIQQFQNINFGTYFDTDANFIPSSFLVESSTDNATWVTRADVTANTNTRVNINIGGNGRYIRLTVRAYQGTQTVSNIANFHLLAAQGATLIQGGNIVADTITANQIAVGTITANEIANTTITGSKIVDGTITATQIADSTITNAEIVDGTITNAEIANATIAGGKLINGTITATQIANSTITATQIASSTITATQIANSTITGSKIAAATITGSNLVNSTITSTQIADSTITGGKIAGATITAANIVDGTITGAKIASSTITGANILDATITGGKIAVDSITADKITIGDFSNIVSGSDFEDATKNPWIMRTGYSLDTAQKHSGSQSLKITGNTSANPTTLNTTFHVNAGESVYVDFWKLTTSDYNGTAGNSKIRFYNASTGALVNAVSFNGVSTSWIEVTGSISFSSSMDVMISLPSDATTGAVWLDDIIVRRTMSGNLIVDGDITGVNITSTTITGSKITVSGKDINSNDAILVLGNNPASYPLVITTDYGGGYIDTANLDANTMMYSSVEPTENHFSTVTSWGVSAQYNNADNTTDLMGTQIGELFVSQLDSLDTETSGVHITSDGKIATTGAITNGGTDFNLGTNNKAGRGAGGRALVQGANNTLIVNYLADFGGGTDINSRVFVKDGIELANPSTTPYIDFHDSTDPHEASDFKMRLYLNSGGHLAVDSTSTTNTCQISYVDLNVNSQGVYNSTSSLGANMVITSDGWFHRSTSATKYKENIEYNITGDYAERILSLNPAAWHDKAENERLADIAEGKAQSQYSAYNQRYYGLIAEDVASVGLDEFVTYGTADELGNREIEGIEYSRLWTLLIPVVKNMKEQYEADIASLKDDNESLRDALYDIMIRLADLEEKQRL